jgi:hypothetical protein
VSSTNGLLDTLVENRVKELVKEWFTDVVEKVDRLPGEAYDSLNPKEWFKDAVTELTKGATDKAIDLLPGSEDLTAAERSGLKKGMEAIIDGLSNGGALPHEKLLELIVGAGETVIDVWSWTAAEKENPTFRFPSLGGGPTEPLAPIKELTPEELCILTGCDQAESTTQTPGADRPVAGNQPGSTTTTEQTAEPSGRPDPRDHPNDGPGVEDAGPEAEGGHADPPDSTNNSGGEETGVFVPRDGAASDVNPPVTQSTYPDGTTVVTYADGSEVTFNPDGSASCEGPCGEDVYQGEDQETDGSGDDEGEESAPGDPHLQGDSEEESDNNSNDDAEGDSEEESDDDSDDDSEDTSDDDADEDSDEDSEDDSEEESSDDSDDADDSGASDEDDNAEGDQGLPPGDDGSSDPLRDYLIFRLAFPELAGTQFDPYARWDYILSMDPSQGDPHATNPNPNADSPSSDFTFSVWDLLNVAEEQLEALTMPADPQGEISAEERAAMVLALMEYGSATPPTVINPRPEGEPELDPEAPKGPPPLPLTTAPTGNGRTGRIDENIGGTAKP